MYMYSYIPSLLLFVAAFLHSLSFSFLLFMFPCYLSLNLSPFFLYFYFSFSVWPASVIGWVGLASQSGWPTKPAGG